jgi:hypothetical protein
MSFCDQMCETMYVVYTFRLNETVFMFFSSHRRTLLHNLTCIAVQIKEKLNFANSVLFKSLFYFIIWIKPSFLFLFVKNNVAGFP